MSETVSIELPKLPHAVEVEALPAEPAYPGVKRYKANGTEFWHTDSDVQQWSIDVDLKRIAERVAVREFMDSERVSQRVEEAAKILYADMTGRFRPSPTWDYESSGVHKRYKSAAKRLLDAVDSGLV